MRWLTGAFVVLVALPACADETAEELGPYVAGLKSPYVQQRIECAQRLRAMGEKAAPAIPTLVALLADANRTGHPEWAMVSVCPGNEAVKALVAIGPAAARPLVAALGSPDPLVRRRAAEALHDIGEARPSAPLAPAVGPLERLLRGDPVVDVRAAAARALGVLRAIDPLAAALKDADPTVRALAAHAMIVRDARAIPPLMEALDDRDARVRGEAVDSAGFVAGATGDRRAVPALIERLADKEPWIRTRAAEALGRARDPRAIEPLIRARHGTHAGGAGTSALMALEAYGEPWARARLIEIVKAGDEDLGPTAAEVLASLGEKAAVEPLLAALAGKPYPDRSKVVNALARLGEARDPRLMETMLRILKEGPWPEREQAAFGLGRIGDRRAIGPLMAALKDPSPWVRTRAAYALQAITGEDFTGGEQP
jgi:HEAT repeat protein